MKLFIVLACWSAAGLGFGAQDAKAQEVERANQIDKAITWLPADTEALIVASKPGTLPALDLSEQRLKLAEFMHVLTEIGLSEEFLKPQGIGYKFVVNGTRNQTGAKDLGLLHYEGCKIVSLGDGELGRLKLVAAKKSVRQTQIGGLAVYVLEDSPNGDKWTYYVTFDQEYMFCATDKGYLSEVLARRAKPQSARALPQTLEEWRFVDKACPIWGVRHGLPRRPVVVDQSDDRLVGYAVSLDPAKKRVTVVSISNHPDGHSLAKKTLV